MLFARTREQHARIPKKSFAAKPRKQPKHNILPPSEAECNSLELIRKNTTFAWEKPRDMKMHNTTFRYSFIIAIILMAAFVRLLPHPHNFTPLGAMALFGGAYFSRKAIAFLAPLATLWISDIFLNNLILKPQFPQYYPEGFIWFTSTSIYIAFVAIVALGWFMLKKTTVPRVFGASLTASALFFLFTNFSVWMGSSVYPQNLGGLITCYIAGIPFFWNTLLGDLVYSTVMFGAFALVFRRSTVQV